MNTKDLKFRSRELLNGHHSRFGSIVLSYLVLLFLCQYVPSMIFTDITKPFSFVSAILLSYLMTVISDLLVIGLMRIALSICRGQYYAFSDLFHAFRNQSDQFVKMQLILTGISTLPGIPLLFLNVISDHFALTIYEYYGLLFLFSILAGVLTLVITLRLKMAAFVIMDDPDLGAIEALKLSWNLTRGHYFKLLGLYISFIGMYLLSIISLMIGYILVYPYVQTSLALYYEDLKTNYANAIGVH